MKQLKNLSEDQLLDLVTDIAEENDLFKIIVANCGNEIEAIEAIKVGTKYIPFCSVDVIINGGLKGLKGIKEINSLDFENFTEVSNTIDIEDFKEIDQFIHDWNKSSIMKQIEEIEEIIEEEKKVLKTMLLKLSTT